jgi:TrmH family RNA methyltransferase
VRVDREERRAIDDTAWRGAIADARRAMAPTGRRGLARCVIEGLRLHERALRAGVVVDLAIVAEGLARRDEARVRELLERLRARGTRLHRAPDAAIVELAEGRAGAAIVGIARLAPAPPLEEVAGGGKGDPARLLVAADVAEPGNVGALVRTGLAAGVAAFVAAGASDPLHPKAVRTSMGSLFRLPVLRLDSVAEALERLKAAGVRTVGAVASGGTPLPRLPVDRRPIAVVVGREATGLGPQTLARLDDRVTIPMRTRIDSYSVNAAAAIVLYEIERRGWPT